MPASTRQYELASRRAKALELRKVGMTYATIAQALSVSVTQARRDVRHALTAGAQTRQGDRTALLNLELERLDMVLPALARKVREGDHAAIDRWLRATDLRRKLLGLSLRRDQQDGQELPVKILELTGETP